MTSSPVFISYSRVDEVAARHLYDDLQKCGVPVWIDQENIPGGAEWRLKIERAIRHDCRYFLSLLSDASVESRGYVNREIRLALEVLEEYPPDRIFIIPVRLESCMPSHPRLRDLNWIDMFPDWEDGIRRILVVVTTAGDVIVAEPQRVRWAPTRGGPAGIDIVSHPGAFVPWTELKMEVQSKLLPQVREIQPRCRALLGEFRRRKNWIIRVIDKSRDDVANVWFGTNPEDHWNYDGLVRVGPAKKGHGPPVWQTFQRYSDGSYRRIRVHSP